MSDEDIYDWKAARVDNSRPPLRWIANIAGGVASNALLRGAWAQEDGKDNGFKYWLDGKLYKYLFPIYRRWGTFYKFNIHKEEEE